MFCIPEATSTVTVQICASEFSAVTVYSNGVVKSCCVPLLGFIVAFSEIVIVGVSSATLVPATTSILTV